MRKMCYSPNMIDDLKVDKTSFSVVTGIDNTDDVAYWHAASPAKRLQALEIMRQINYGYNPVTDRLQRILTIVENG